MIQRHRQRGLTLLETLVTLIIAAMVATLMSEGLYQLGRVEQRMGTGQLQARLERLHTLWLQQALEGLRAGEIGTADAVRGGPRQIQGVSSMLPVAEPAGPMPISLSLAYRQNLDQTELTLEVGAPEGRLQSTVLARWKGDEGRLSYLDPRGEWVSDWPPRIPNAPLLPRAVAVHASGDRLLLLAAMQASPQSLGKRAEIDKLP